jgi:photosystem II stability/assembly factor-like uncharacterized protein
VTGSLNATMRQRSVLWLLVAGAVLPLLGGCGTLTRLTGGTHTTSARAATPTTRRLVATYIASVNRQTGTITFTPAPLPDTGSGAGGAGRGFGRRPRKNGGVRLQSTNFGPADKLNITGTAAFDGVAGILKGFVNISTTNQVTFYDVKAVISQITSTGSVTVKTPSGMTDLAGAPAPYIDHGNVSKSNPQSRLWEFNDPAGVSFTFRVLLYANVWNYSTGDGSTNGGLFFLNATNGWAVGVGGKILATSDGGVTWRAQNAATTRTLNDVFFVDANRGWAVGESGTILVTTNGGRSWDRQTSPVALGLNSVRFLNATTGWIVGNRDDSLAITTILRTTNGGATWTRIMAVPEGNLYGLDVANDGSGQLTAVGSGGDGPMILRSTDSGASWTELTPPAGLSSFVQLLAVEFPSSARGWAVGTLGTVLTTTNGGTTWTQQTTSGGSINLNGVTFVSASVGYIVGQGGTIMKTTNGGSTWVGQNSPTSSDLWAVASLPGDTTHAWASGASGSLIYTTAGGSTWNLVSAASSVALNAVKFVDHDTGWIVGGSGTMLRTTDGGATWIRMSGNGETLTAVDFVNRTNGWAVGGRNTILRTSNGGASWSQITLPSSVSAAYGGVKFLNTSVGFVVGSGKNGITPTGSDFTSGLYLKSTNGGTNWTVKPDPNGTVLPPLIAVDFADDGTTGWIVGGSGRILKTTNTGASWSTQTSGSAQSLFSVKAIDAMHACAVGQKGTILRTDDGGATWVAQNSGLSVDLNGVDFVDADRGWIVGGTRSVQEGSALVTHETVLRTTDGGAHWVLVDTNSNARLNAVQFVDADDGWIVGANGFMKRFH